MKQLSVALATYNEGQNIGRCLEAVAKIAWEIIVVDGESTDNTVAIATKYGAKVIETTNKPMFHTNKQLAIDAAKGDWLLLLDADEVADENLVAQIKKCLENEPVENAFYIKRKNFFLGKWLTKGGQYPDKVIRLFKQGQAHLPQQSVHEQLAVNGKVGELQGHLWHYNAPTFRRYLNNANRYTQLTAMEMKTKGIQLNLFNDIWYLGIKPMIIFFTLYLRHRGYVDGFPGFVFALFSGLHVSLAYMKLGDLVRNESIH